WMRSRNQLAARRRSNLDSFTVSAGIAYAQPSIGALSLFATLTDSRYPNRQFDTGVGLVTDGIRNIAGTVQLERRIGSRLQGSISAGYVVVDPDIAGVRSFRGTSYGADIRFTPGGRASFTLAAARSVEASNRLDVSYYRQDEVKLGLHYIVSPLINADLRTSWRSRHFAATPAITGVTPPQTDRNYAAGGGLSYAMNRRIDVRLDADYQRRNAAIDLFDYDGLRVGLSMNYRM
ncbi:MAG: outer membrane beta-barrel protein, partial [Alphaproteobacteria bacterium]|nr:outer membrane beta-barrel protein [Alphaproteobacteria bacterium]